MSELIPVTKGGEYIEVHPLTLAEHERLGWVRCERREPVQADESPRRGRKQADA